MASGRKPRRAGHNEHDADTRRMRIMTNEHAPFVNGDVVPYDELRARELHQFHGNGSQFVARMGSKKSKTPFLKKGARGWWMRRPDAKKKVVKHTLTSTTEEVEIKTMAKRLQPREDKRVSVSLAKPCSLAPGQVRTVENALQTWSPLESPMQPAHDGDQDGKTVQQPMTQPHHVAIWKHASLHSTTSTDMMGMQNLRQSYEAKQEREANDIAEFEAIERDLAAEKEAFLAEKLQKAQDRSAEDREQIYCDNQSGANRWSLPYSSFLSDLHEQEEMRRQTIRRNSSFDGSLDGEIDSALVFDDYSALSKDDGISEQDGLTCQLRDHFGYGNRYGDPSSALSAVSFGDSVSCDDESSLQPRQNGAYERSSNIATAGLLSSQNKQDSLVSEGARHQATKREVYFAEHGGDGTNARGHNKSDISDFIPEGSDPVSSLMQRVFGKFEQDENSNSGVSPYEEDMSSIDDSTNMNTAWRNLSPPPPSRVQDRPLLSHKQKLPDKQKTLNTITSTSKSEDDDKRIRQTKGKTAALSHVPCTGSSNDTRTHSRDQSARPANAGMMLPAVTEEKLNELEAEVKHYKSETLQLQKRKNYYDQELKKFALERDEFERFQQEQRLLIEKEWERARTKMKEEAKLQERQWKLRMNTTISHHDQNDRGNFETLEAQIGKMQIDEKAGVSKWKAGNDNLRQRVLELEEKNRELMDEIKFLEKDRLEQLKHYERLVKKAQETSRLALKESGVTTSMLNKKNELRIMNDSFAVEGPADTLLQKWNDSRKSSLKTHDEIDTTARSAYLDCVQSNAVDSCNPTRCSFDRENPRSSSELYENDGRPSTKDMAADHALASNATATYEWALPAAEDGEVLSDISDADQIPTNCEEDGAISASISSLLEHEVVTQEIEHRGGKKEVLYMDGSREILYSDGNKKKIDANGHTVIQFTNGDHKEVFPDTGISVYYYYEAHTKLTTYPDNQKVYEFPNQQIETSWPNGTTEIQFPDGTKKTIRPNGDEFSVFPDGTTMLEEQLSGLREVMLLNQKKIRYYPDGQMVCVSLSGQEICIQSDSELQQLLKGT